MRTIGKTVKKTPGLALATNVLPQALASVKAPAPPAQPNEPVPPAGLKQAIGEGLKGVRETAHEIKKVTEEFADAKSVLDKVANPGAAVADGVAQLGAAADEAMNKLVSGLAKAIDPKPAARL